MMRIRLYLMALALGVVIAAPAVAQRTTLLVHADRPGPTIAPEIYGEFVEHLGRGVYEGIWVGDDPAIPNTRGIRNDVVAALKQVRVPVVRWPGGCFADSYHWRNGTGPRERRPSEINASWGGAPDTNAFGTHEFMEFLDQVGSRAFVSINVGSGSVQEADDWMRYMTAPVASDPGRARAANGRAEPWPVPFVGVGNESWGCGGNMTAENLCRDVPALRRLPAQLFGTAGQFDRRLGGQRRLCLDRDDDGARD